MQKGERVNGIEKDPLESADADIVVEYNNVPGFLRREMSTTGDDKLRIAPHGEGVETVKNVLEKFRKRKEEIQKKKQLSQPVEHHIQEEPVEEEEKKETTDVVDVQQEEVKEEEPAKEEDKPIIEEASPEKHVEEEEDAPFQVPEDKEEVAEEVKHEVEEAPPTTESKGYVEDRKELEGCEEATVAQNKPFKVTLKKGETYYYCTCGRSKNQPFCDGSHNEEGCTYKPLKFVFEGEDENPDEEQKVSLCGCKHNKTDKGPYCDGSHKNIKAPEW